MPASTMLLMYVFSDPSDEAEQLKCPLWVKSGHNQRARIRKVGLKARWSALATLIRSRLWEP